MRAREGEQQMTATTTRVGPAADQERALATLTMAFSTDPVLRWVYPDPHQYVTHFPGLMRHFAGRAFEHQTSH